ncbi:hypothetical protein GCM10009425_30030 [Pseudomonas asuensis]|uniref:Uncharacterized protein n=1 Tax=Pseudomonas asuensis TaxID=1825787 RepID=A0ABQ2GWE5_9PSED|nr:hypothetical protein GCM10009425_30030 [Pseudomonas asuensis]
MRQEAVGLFNPYSLVYTYLAMVSRQRHPSANAHSMGFLACVESMMKIAFLSIASAQRSLIQAMLQPILP